MLTGALPASQTSIVSGQTVTWGKGVVTSFGFLYGNDLMNKYQGMYGGGVLVGDGTPYCQRQSDKINYFDVRNLISLSGSNQKQWRARWRRNTLLECERNGWQPYAVC